MVQQAGVYFGTVLKGCTSYIREESKEIEVEVQREFAMFMCGTEGDWTPLSRYGQGNTQRSICQPPAHAPDDTFSLSHCEANTGLCLRTYMAYFNLICGLCRRAGPSRMVLSVHMASGGGTLRSFSLLCGITHELILPFRNNVDVRRRCQWCRACANALHPCRRWRRESWSLCLYHAMMRKRHQK
jgi:hypothetical protein